jgi:hypothetical protein
MEAIILSKQQKSLIELNPNHHSDFNTISHVPAHQEEEEINADAILEYSE